MPSAFTLLAGFGAWNWFILAALLFTLETFLPGVHFLWFGIAAVVVGGLALLIGVSWPCSSLSVDTYSVPSVVKVMPKGR